MALLRGHSELRWLADADADASDNTAKITTDATSPPDGGEASDNTDVPRISPTTASDGSTTTSPDSSPFSFSSSSTTAAPAGNTNPCADALDTTAIDFTVSSRNRTLALLRLNLLAYPSCRDKFQHNWDRCEYADSILQDIWNKQQSIYGSNITNADQETQSMQALQDSCYEWLNRQLKDDEYGHSFSFSRVSVPQDKAPFDYGVEAFEYVINATKTTILIFRGTLSPGDYANMENLILDYLLELSSARMKDAWTNDAGLPWTDEMEQRSNSSKIQDALYKLTIRAGESFVLGQDRPLKNEFNKISLAQELHDAISNDTTVSAAIGGMTVQEAKSTGYWKLTKYIADQANQRAMDRGHTLVITGHSQGGTRAQLASMYLRHASIAKQQQQPLLLPTVTFAATGAACVARLLFDTHANLLSDVNPFVPLEHMQEYVHPLDPWGNAMLGQDVGGATTCYWGKTAMWELQEYDPAFSYCSQIYGYSGTTLIAADSNIMVQPATTHDNNKAKTIKAHFQQCRYFTHSIEVMLYRLYDPNELLFDGSTTSGCHDTAVIPENDSQRQCPTGSLSVEEEESIAALVATTILLMCCCCCCCICSCLCRRKIPRRNKEHVTVSQVDHDNGQDQDWIIPGDNHDEFELSRLT